MKKTAWIAVALCALLAVSSFSCGGGGGSCPECIDPGAWNYPENQFVLDYLELPLTSADAKALAFDLDHNGTPDNQLGNILAALGSAMGDTNPQESLEASMAKGEIIVLFAIYAEDMQLSPKSNLWAFLGEQADPELTDGPQPGGTFTVDTTNSPADAYFGGKIKNGGGLYGGDEAELLLSIALTGTQPLNLSLRAVNVEFDVSADGLVLENGRLGGAITETDLNGQVLPTVANLLQDQMAGKCSTTTGTCVCESGSGAETIQSMFDTDGSCDVTLAEVQNNNIIKAFLKGDVDLKDGSKALSLAVGFSAVNAVFTHTPPLTQ
ncbi:MAG: hypothetical protein HY906_12815 [Deltaproteobacteria bacterium]|nr:hypothetical protein [Deltaproteobacteria bacterium]